MFVLCGGPSSLAEISTFWFNLEAVSGEPATIRPVWSSVASCHNAWPNVTSLSKDVKLLLAWV